MYKSGIEEARKELDKDKIVGSYNIKFLDDFLLGITSDDFVLLGAETGCGKTEIAYEIAFHNSKKLNVHLFALEAHKGEPYFRKSFKYVAEQYYNDESYKAVPFLEMNYRNYVCGKLDVDKYKDEAFKRIEEEHSKLTVHYREGQFTIQDLIKAISGLEDKCEMIVLDHVDYFDLNLDESENAQVTKIMKKLDEINMTLNIPIIVVSHLRKRTSKDYMLPTIDDFMGSGNKAKQVKTAILVARDKTQEDYHDGLFGTWMYVPKSRLGGTGNLYAHTTYNIKKNSYTRGYTLHKFYEGKLIAIDRTPSWYKGRGVLDF